MAIEMNNKMITNNHKELVLIRSAEAAPYLTVGSKSYLKDQLVGKRNGTEYEFVIRDAGEYVEGMDITGHVSTLKERPVKLSVELGNIAIDTNLVERVTEMKWDDEVAKPNGEKIAKGLVKATIAKDLGKQNTAFVGVGWMPLFKASNFLESVTSEAQYAFLDPMIQSICRSTGKDFEPADKEGVDPIYRKGLKGSIAEAEVRSQQGLPTIEISTELAAELATATVNSYATGANYDTLTLNGVTETIPAGTPLFVKGVMACDLVGEATSAPKAFIAIEDATAGAVKVRKVDFDGVGTKEASAKPKANDKLVNPIEAGVYFTGIFRVNGAMEFDTLPELDWSNADSRVTSPNGITLHEGRAVDVITGSNKTRWAIASIAGIIEPRVCTYVCVKDATANVVSVL